MLSSRILLAAAISTWLAIPAGAQTPPGNEPPPAAPSNIPGPTPPARTNPANPAPAPAPAQDRSVVPAAPAPAPAPVVAPAQAPAPQTPAPGTGSGDDAAAARPRRPPASPSCAASPSRRRPACRRPARRPVILTIAPVLREAGQHLGGRTGDLPLLHRDAAQPAVAEPVGALRRGRRRPAAQRLPLAVGDQLPRRPVDRGDRLHVPERRHRQADQVRHRGAAADQDRRLHGQQAARVDEDRREAEGRERHHPPRLVRRRRADPPRQGDREGHAVREGISRQLGDRTPSRRSPAGPRP